MFFEHLEEAKTRGAFHYAKATGERSGGISEQNGTTFSD